MRRQRNFPWGGHTWNMRSPLLSGDGSMYRKYGETVPPSIATQLVGDYFEHLGAYHLGATVNNNTRSDLPDLMSERHSALVEVKGSTRKTDVKIQVHQIDGLLDCDHTWKRRWFAFFVHETAHVTDETLNADQLLESLSTSQLFGLVVHVSVVKAMVDTARVQVKGPYQSSRGGWEVPPIACVRPIRDLTPLSQRTESTLCELGLNPEDYDIHREVANTHTNPFIMTWIVRAGQMRRIIRERERDLSEEVPF